MSDKQSGMVVETDKLILRVGQSPKTPPALAGSRRPTMKAQLVEVFLPDGQKDEYSDVEFQANPQFEQIVIFTDKGAVSYSGCKWKVLADEEWTAKFKELMGDAESLEMEQAKKMIAAAKGSGDAGWFHQ